MSTERAALEAHLRAIAAGFDQMNAAIDHAETALADLRRFITEARAGRFIAAEALVSLDLPLHPAGGSPCTG